jgi:hypothetical protein
VSTLGHVCSKAFCSKYTSALTFRSFYLEPPHRLRQPARRGCHGAVGPNGKSRPAAAAQRRSVVHGLRAWCCVRVWARHPAQARGEAEEAGFLRGFLRESSEEGADGRARARAAMAQARRPPPPYTHPDTTARPNAFRSPPGHRRPPSARLCPHCNPTEYLGGRSRGVKTQGTPKERRSADYVHEPVRVPCSQPL